MRALASQEPLTLSKVAASLGVSSTIVGAVGFCTAAVPLTGACDFISVYFLLAVMRLVAHGAGRSGYHPPRWAAVRNGSHRQKSSVPAGFLSFALAQASLAALQPLSACFRRWGAHLGIEKRLESLCGLKEPAASGADTAVFSQGWLNASHVGDVQQECRDNLVPVQHT